MTSRFFEGHAKLILLNRKIYRIYLIGLHSGYEPVSFSDVRPICTLITFTQVQRVMTGGEPKTFCCKVARNRTTFRMVENVREVTAKNS